MDARGLTKTVLVPQLDDEVPIGLFAHLPYGPHVHVVHQDAGDAGHIAAAPGDALRVLVEAQQVPAVIGEAPYLAALVVGDLRLQHCLGVHHQHRALFCFAHHRRDFLGQRAQHAHGVFDLQASHDLLHEVRDASPLPNAALDVLAYLVSNGVFGGPLQGVVAPVDGAPDGVEHIQSHGQRYLLVVLLDVLELFLRLIRGAVGEEPVRVHPMLDVRQQVLALPVRRAVSWPQLRQLALVIGDNLRGVVVGTLALEVGLDHAPLPRPDGLDLLLCQHGLLGALRRHRARGGAGLYGHSAGLGLGRS